MVHAPFPSSADEVPQYSLSRDDFSILSYNVANLFDGTYDGGEYPEFQPPRWKKKYYQKRLLSVGYALQSISPFPAVLVLQEIEKQSIVEEIRRYFFPRYRYVVASDNPHSATENAIMSTYPIVHHASHAISYEYNNRSRYVLEIIISLNKVQDEPMLLQLLIVHLKSKKNDSLQSSFAVRRAQYDLIEKVAKEDVPTIIIGDFNDNNPARALSFKTCHDEAGTFHDSIQGSYLYKNRWEQLDWVLLDEGACKMFYHTQTLIWDKEPFITNYKKPNAFQVYKKNFKGLSDHLPIIFWASWK